MTRAAVLLLVAASLTGCSETDPGAEALPDSERIVGTWDASTASVNVRSVPIPIRVADLTASEDQQTFAFESGGRFTFVFDPQDGRTISITALGQTLSVPVDQTVRLSGTYTLNEQTDQITFSTIDGQTADDFRMGYGFTGASLDLTANDVPTLVRLFGFAETDAGRLAALIDGGQITYRQSGASASASASVLASLFRAAGYGSRASA